MADRFLLKEDFDFLLLETDDKLVLERPITVMSEISVAVVSGVPAAFSPTIEGFAENTVGGAGGTLYTITNTNDGGPGSLREACEASGVRIVEFDVSGDIILTSRISITDDHITIRGWTAPDGGICVRTDPAVLTEAIEIKASEVIISHLRDRPGASTLPSGTLDSISIRSGDNICIDHCSLTFATDGVLDIFSNPGPISNVTIQWCIIAWGLVNSTHISGAHSTGLLTGATPASGNVVKDITVHHNILQHNRSRNPWLQLSAGVVDCVNNIIWDNGADVGLQVNDDLGYTPKVNIVKNYHLGDNVNRGYYARSDVGSVGDFYILGNYTPWHINPDDADELTGVLWSGDHGEVSGVRHTAPAIASETGALVAFQEVIGAAGATWPKRDLLDRRITTNLINSVNEQIDDPSEVGGWPDLTI